MKICPNHQQTYNVAFQVAVFVWIFVLGGKALATPTQPYASSITTVKPSRSFADLGTVFADTQTSDGFLWFATAKGLQRFDGIHFRSFNEVAFPAMGLGSVHGLLATHQGDLWMALGEGRIAYDETGNLAIPGKRGEVGLARMTKGIIARWPTANGTNQPAWISTMIEGNDGTIWIGTEQGLFRLDSNRAVGAPSRQCELSLPSGIISSLVFDLEGALWIGTNRGVFVLRKGECFPTMVIAPVAALALDGTGGLLAGTHDGLVLMKDGAIANRWRKKDGLIAQGIERLFVDRGKMLWIVSDEGISTSLVTKPTTPVRKYLRKLGIAVFSDREGSVWLGLHEEGALQFYPSNVSTLGTLDGLATKDAFVFTVLASRDGSLWSTTTDGLSHIVGDVITNYRIGTDIPSWTVRSLAESTDGTLWIAAGAQGLVEFHSGSFKLHSTRDKLPGGGVRSVFVTTSGALWLARDNGDLTRFDEGRPTSEGHTISIRAGLCSGEVTVMAEAPDGAIWAGSANGLAQIRNSEARCYRLQDGVALTQVSAVTADTDGTIWVGSLLDLGLIRFRDGHFSSVTPAQGFPRGGIFRIMKSPLGNIWFSSSRGVHRLQVQDYDAVVQGRTPSLLATTFDRSDGLLSDEQTASFDPAGAQTTDGRFWFPSKSGISMVFESEPSKSSTVAEPIIESIRIGARLWTNEASIEAAPGSKEIEFAYNAPTFVFPHRIRIEHKLVGIDIDWRESADQRSALYANLQPQTYTFLVRSFDERGQRSPTVASVQVHIPPFVFQTWWFKTISTLLLIAFITFVYRSRVRVREAAATALRAERARIARDLHDHLGQGLGAIGLLNDALELSNNNLPESAQTIIGRLRAAVQSTSKGVDELIWDLRSTDGPTSLVAVLRQTVVRMTLPNVNVRLRMPNPAIQVSSIVLRELPMFISEAITNAATHGGADTIDIDVVEHASILKVTIQDNGIGLEASASRASSGVGGFGIVGMQERAQRMNGAFSIQSDGGIGTRVLIVIDKPS